MPPRELFVLYAALVGLIVGSYLNVVIYRLPRRISTVRPRSRCPACGAPIRARDNLPLVSWVLLGGRCRDCGAAISPRYPLLEAATAGLFALARARSSSSSRRRAATCRRRPRAPTSCPRSRGCGRCSRPVPTAPTKTISREHAIVIEHGNLLTVTGGKWTTYRRMALDALAQATRRGLLDERPCTTEHLRLAIDPGLETAHRAAETSAARGDATGLHAYLRLAVEREQARRADDLLARRLRVGLLQDGLMELLLPAATAALGATLPLPR